MAQKFIPLMDFENLFASDPDAKVIPYGMQMFTSPAQVKEFMSSVFKEDTGNLGFAASCDCGHLTGNFYIGHKCDRPGCNSIVKESLAGDLRFKSWIEIPGFMPPFLHPAAFYTFRRWMGTYNKRPLIEVLLDATVNADEYPMELANNCGFGYKNFYDNFDKIVNYLLDEYPAFQKPSALKKRDNIKKFIKMYRHLMFVRYVPILNDNLHVISSSGSMKHVDKSSTHIFKTIIELNNLAYCYQTEVRPDLYVEQHMLDMYIAYIAYVHDIVYKRLIKKPGLIRRYLLGTRCHFSFRGVIVPITGEHDGDEIVLPWRVMVSCMKLEILNLLQNRYGYDVNRALDVIHRAQFKFDPLVQEILLTLKKECRFGKFKILLGRNPEDLSRSEYA